MAGTRPGWSQPAARGTGGTPAPVAWTVLFGDDAVADGPYVLDRHLDDVTGLHPDRRGPGESNSAGRAGGDHVAGGQAGKGGEELDRRGNADQHLRGTRRLHHGSVERRADSQVADVDLVGGDDLGADRHAAG